MSSPRRMPFRHRLTRVRSDLRALSIDGFVVTHLPNIRYLCGFTGSAGALVLTETACRLVVDFRYAAAARSLIASDPALAAGVSVAVADQKIDDAVIELLKAEGVMRVGIEGAWMSVAAFHRLTAAIAAAAANQPDTPPLRPAVIPTERVVERVRAIKDDEEIAILREAGRRLKSAAAEVRRFVSAGRTERDVAADIDALLRRCGFDRPAFETIVASGPNGALPHAQPTARVLEQADGVVLDFGGVYDGYCVDLTRTVQLGAAPDGFRRLFEAVAEAQSAAIAAIRPGVKASDIDTAARTTLARFGLAETFGHGTGHGLGLEVHEEPRIGRYSHAQPDDTLAPGMVFTVEPGAYIEGLGGVRIEDDVLVTEVGCEILTR